ncbi:MAG: DUF2249 domain-containing protein [Mesorhizobium sp.]|nr:MAG: DUF2249 domain-containing protein [Mesorhizobium sp.]RWL88321.1 MAG: DUF2249 domain-containing protein [Mesorhizobium sp.]RWL97014.1 MAG: DUF2249 domain-containing protein [Mesorhizobium sp.]RWM02645.1 MAG: DUF2249 domain-containing protein [Mesorhizobium sp.]TIP42914.1 MAG: DUF2249 domain-containing protein [Mesorhizobium sp.]
MSMFDGLQPGQAFSVLLGFDPGRLEGQFEAFFGDDFAWVCLDPGPPEWLIEIRKRRISEQFQEKCERFLSGTASKQRDSAVRRFRETVKRSSVQLP